MYAILETGGKQYRVSPGETIKVEKVPGIHGDSYVFENVLAVSDQGAIQCGAPYLSGVTVKGTVLRQAKARKILVFKYRAKTNYRRRYGHRQPYTEIRIDSVDGNAEGTTTA